ncbi:MAG: hypothetical protein U0791_10640 [Gemmataceae bacterium]
MFLTPRSSSLRLRSAMTTKRNPLAFEELEAREVPAVFIWKGDGAGGGAWNDGKMWQDTNGKIANAVPGILDTARFTDASTDNCTVTASDQVGRLEIEDYPSNKHLLLNGGTELTVFGGKLATTTPTGTDFTIGGAGTLRIGAAASFVWNSGTMAGPGTTIVGQSGTLYIDASSAATLDARLAGRTLETSAFQAPFISSGEIQFRSGRIYCQNLPGDPNQCAQIVNNGLFSVSNTAAQIEAGNPYAFANQPGGTVSVNLAGAGSTFELGGSFHNLSSPTKAFGVCSASAELGN